MKSWMPEVIVVARLAGEIILEVYETDFHIKQKEDNTPVTTADLAANELIVQKLSALTPDIPVLSEESIEIPFAERRHWKTYWLVDPLDGTRAFIDRTGEFSVNIALIHNHQPIMGVIHSPVKQCSFYAYRGSGAFYEKKSQQVSSLQVRDTSSKKLVVAGTLSSRCQALEDFLTNLKSIFDDYELKYMGSSLKSCMVAEGEADIYVRLGPTSEWDTAAAQCIVEEAGGMITDTQMRVLTYNTRETLLNPHFFVFGDKSIPWNQFLAEKPL